MSSINNRKVAIVGCGFVGAASAFALMQSGLFSEMVLIDADRLKAEGEALDISHGLPFAKPMVPGRWSRAVRAMALREIYFLFLYSVGGFSAGMAAVLFILFLHRMAG